MVLVGFSTKYFVTQVNPNSRQKKQVELYQFLVDLVKAEDTCRERVRDSELEVITLLITHEKSVASLCIPSVPTLLK